MILGLDSAAAGMKVRMDQQDVIAENLANINTNGYHRKVSSLTSFDATLRGATGWSEPDSGPCDIPTLTVREDSTQGSMMQTGVHSDLALDGPGYLVVQTKNGTQQTRGGNFHIDTSSKQLVNSSGLPLLGEKGPIKVTSTDWTISEDGTVRDGGNIVDKLLIQKDPTADPKSSPRVESGFLEQSNVNSVQEMVSMITAMRSYESCSKAIQSIDGTLDKVINQMQK